MIKQNDFSLFFRACVHQSFKVCSYFIYPLKAALFLFWEYTHITKTREIFVYILPRRKRLVQEHTQFVNSDQIASVSSPHPLRHPMSSSASCRKVRLEIAWLALLWMLYTLVPHSYFSFLFSFNVFAFEHSSSPWTTATLSTIICLYFCFFYLASLQLMGLFRPWQSFCL